MSSDKYLQLVALLIKKTKAGTADWQATAREGVFSLSLPDYSVLITQVRNEASSSAKDVLFQIIDADGRTVDAFKDWQATAAIPESSRQEWWRGMAALYDDARRKALGVDKALDTLIQQLGKD